MTNRIGRAMRVSLALCALSHVPASAQPRDAAITLTINSQSPGARIDRNIFGQFAEHLGSGIYGGLWVGKTSPIPNVRGIRSDVVQALKAIKVPNVRWPGGCFADEYHWRGGIGPQAGRHVTINSNWGGATEPNSFGTDEFMDFVGQIGADAYVSVNVGSGTVEEASDWMAYMTADPRTTAGKQRGANGHVAPYKVKYVGLGNEAWGCGGSMTPEHYVDVMKPFARFVRNYNPAQTGEQAMQRIAVGPTDDDTGYTEAVMKAWKGHDWAWNIEGLSFHSYTTAGWPPSYPSTGFDEAGYAKLVKATLAMEGMIAKHSAIMDKYDPEKKVALAIDEWGVWLAPLPGTDPGFLVQQNSLRDAIIAALNINIFARHADRVRMTNIAQMINVLQAMIMTDKARMVLTPTYHVYKMYVPFQDASFIPVSFEGGSYANGDVRLPRIDAMAARGKDGKLWLALVNLDPARSAQISPSIAGASPKSATGTVLTAANVNSVNSFEAPQTVLPRPVSFQGNGESLSIDLPAKSVTVLQIEG